MWVRELDYSRDWVVHSIDSTCRHLLDFDVIFFLLNTITNDHSFNYWSIEITYQTLINILNQSKNDSLHYIDFPINVPCSDNDSLNFLTEIENDGKKTLVSTDIIDTIIHMMDTGSPSSQIRAMNILFNCLRYCEWVWTVYSLCHPLLHPNVLWVDLRQQLSNSRVTSLLIQRLNLGNPSVKKASLNTLLKLAEYGLILSHFLHHLQVPTHLDLTDHIRPTLIQPSIVSSLLEIIWRDWTELSEPSLMLLTRCMEHSKWSRVLFLSF